MKEWRRAMAAGYRQLEISFEQDALITDALSRGAFSVLIELGSDRRDAEAYDRVLSEEFGGFQRGFVLRHGAGSGGISSFPIWSQSLSSPVVYPLSGRAGSVRALQEEAAEARSAGCRNFLAVTGEWSGGSSGAHVDSVEILDGLRDPHKSQTLSVTVNPFVYTPPAQCGQYTRLLRKLSHGAQAVFVQAGWDVRKYQELAWFLQQRELIFPMFVRLRFISLDEARRLSRGLEPGVSVPVVAASTLERLADEPEAFYAYRQRLMALTVIGCRKLGYSGIVLSGTSGASEAGDFLGYLSELERGISSYDDWLSRWEAFTADGSMVPRLSGTSEPAFFLYSNLLKPGQPFFRSESLSYTPYSVTSPGRLALFRAALYGPSGRLWPRRGGDGGASDGGTSYGSRVSRCPRRLAAGPCGHVRPDGFCETGAGPCRFNEIMTLAVERNELYLFEQ